MAEQEGGRPPACPVCSRQMGLCEPSHEKSYWSCHSDHKPAGVVLLGDQIGYSLALARVSLYDTFDTAGVEPFAEIEKPHEVAGLVTDVVLDRLELCANHKQMRQRKQHDQKPDSGDRRSSVDDETEQQTLQALTDGGVVEVQSARPSYFESRDQECTRYGCSADAWFKTVSWNGFISDLCPRCAAEWERDGVVKLDEEFHDQPGTQIGRVNDEGDRDV